MSKKTKIFIGVLTLLIIFLYPFHGAEPINYINRSSGEIETEKVPGEYWLNWLYNNPVGVVSLDVMVSRKGLSEWYGNRMDQPESASKVSEFVNEYNIDLSEAQKQEFTSFNDFFYRKLKDGARPFDSNPEVVISPADGKVFAYQDISNQDFIVKGYRFNLAEYFLDEELASEYDGGSLIIVRLCPTDYHRFHFPLSGDIWMKANFDGDYYSVSPIALRKKIELLCMNKRAFVIINNDYFGDVIVSEVGATMVGSIIQTYKDDRVEKGQEKGYFKFGGSTVILFFKKGAIRIDQDLLENTKRGLETAILMGDQIGIVDTISIQ